MPPPCRAARPGSPHRPPTSAHRSSRRRPTAPGTAGPPARRIPAPAAPGSSRRSGPWRARSARRSAWHGAGRWRSGHRVRARPARRRPRRPGRGRSESAERVPSAPASGRRRSTRSARGGRAAGSEGATWQGKRRRGPWGHRRAASYRRPVSIPVRPGASRPPTPSAVPDPLAPLLDLPGVREAADAARTGIDRLLGHKVLRRESAGVSTESALRGARASAALEGVDVPLAVLRTGDVEDPLVQGALRVSAGLGSMVETWSRAPGQVLARLHVLAAADLADPAALGRPAPHAGPRLSGLFPLVTGTTSAPAIVVAALVHGELAALAPFGTADGVVARAAA